ncbi:Slp family lipoprotein [Tahibacter soli]|uniref:Slp family lipoprotein n=1 Tax=Tahibacter soli TaxID=2983605 RepID=A0A9X3YJC8_9GAMM|nr:Slp family lipoprotein [Tahibacter soli]MDC8012617.1 Slp family lipoprotein [Tahibacter soli]
MRFVLIVVLLAAAAAASARDVPSRGTEPGAAAYGGHEGEVVLWGGRIVALTSIYKQVCIEVRGRRVQADGRPAPFLQRGDGQLFLACDVSGRAREEFRIGDEATFAGTLDRVVTRIEQQRCDTIDRDYYLNSRRERTPDGGCRIWLPVVAVTDSKAWKTPPGGSSINPAAGYSPVRSSRPAPAPRAPTR